MIRKSLSGEVIAGLKESTGGDVAGRGITRSKGPVVKQLGLFQQWGQAVWLEKQDEK